MFCLDQIKSHTVQFVFLKVRKLNLNKQRKSNRRDCWKVKLNFIQSVLCINCFLDTAISSLSLCTLTALSNCLWLQHIYKSKAESQADNHSPFVFFTGKCYRNSLVLEWSSMIYAFIITGSTLDYNCIHNT